MSRFIGSVKEAIVINKSSIYSKIGLNGFMINQNKCGSMPSLTETNSQKIQLTLLDSDGRRKHTELKVDTKLKAYRKLASELTWLGCGALPQALSMGSRTKSKRPRITVQDLCSAGTTLKGMDDPWHAISFCKLYNVHTCSANILLKLHLTSQTIQNFGQKGALTDIECRTHDTTSCIFHCIHRYSYRQQRACHLSNGTEILACTVEADQ